MTVAKDAVEHKRQSGKDLYNNLII